MPVATDAPMRVDSAAMSRPESASACLAAASARWVNRSMRRADLTVDPILGLEVLRLAGEVDGVAGGIEVRDRPRAALAGEQPRPARLDVVPEWRHGAETGDHDAAAAVYGAGHRYIPSPPSTSRTSPVMKEAASEQRNRTAEPTSSGLPIRWSGVF